MYVLRVTLLDYKIGFTMIICWLLLFPLKNVFLNIIYTLLLWSLNIIPHHLLWPKLSALFFFFFIIPKKAVSCLSLLSCFFLRYLVSETSYYSLYCGICGPLMQWSSHMSGIIIVSCFTSELFLNQVRWSGHRLGALLLTVLCNIEVTSI